MYSGESGTYIIGITNNEYRTMNYTMEVRLENQSLPLPENLQNIRLAHNTTLEEPLVITPSIEGKNMKLEFLLFNETEKKVPYQRPAPLDKRYRGGLKMETLESLNIETMETPEGTRLETSENFREKRLKLKTNGFIWQYRL